MATHQHSHLEHFRGSGMTLEPWLEIARANLAPRARELVREQIMEHFQNAIHRYQIEGKSEAEAKEFAIKDLGDAKTAAQGFEKAYLTQKELNEFVNQKTNAEKTSSFLIVLGMLPTLGFFLKYWLQEGSATSKFAPHPASFYIAVVMIFMFGVRSLIARNTPLRKFLVWDSVITIFLTCFSIFWFLLFSGTFNFGMNTGTWMFFCVLFMSLILPYQGYKQFLKFRKLLSL
jgi:hypothetical protein